MVNIEYLPADIARKFEKEIANYVGHSNVVRDGVIVIYVSEYTSQTIGLKSMNIQGKQYQVKVIKLGKIKAL